MPDKRNQTLSLPVANYGHVQPHQVCRDMHRWEQKS
jgi:hypothetical protein